MIRFRNAHLYVGFALAVGIVYWAALLIVYWVGRGLGVWG